MDLTNLSKYRTHLMGFATILITLSHTSLIIGGVIQTADNAFILHIMQVGVDIFLMLSGLGCYFSFANQPNYFEFEKKRALRVFVPYFLISIPLIISTIIIYNQPVMKTLYHYSIISFFISGDINGWFLASILLLYIVFPLIFRLVNNSRLTCVVCIIIFSIVLLPIWDYLPNTMNLIHGIFLNRVPIFIFGSLIGKLIFEKKNVFINKIICVFVFFISVIAIALNFKFNNGNIWSVWTITRILFFPLALSLSLIFSQFLNIKRDKTFLFNKVFSFLGGISLTMYLLFHNILHSVIAAFNHFDLFNLNETLLSIITNVISIIISIISATFIQKVCNMITSKIKKNTAIIKKPKV